MSRKLAHVSFSFWFVSLYHQEKIWKRITNKMYYRRHLSKTSKRHQRNISKSNNGRESSVREQLRLSQTVHRHRMPSALWKRAALSGEVHQTAEKKFLKCWNTSRITKRSREWVSISFNTLFFLPDLRLILTIRIKTAPFLAFQNTELVQGDIWFSQLISVWGEILSTTREIQRDL